MLSEPRRQWCWPPGLCHDQWMMLTFGWSTTALWWAEMLLEGCSSVVFQIWCWLSSFVFHPHQIIGSGQLPEMWTRELKKCVRFYLYFKIVLKQVSGSSVLDNIPNHFNLFFRNWKYHSTVLGIKRVPLILKSTDKFTSIFFFIM